MIYAISALPLVILTQARLVDYLPRLKLFVLIMSLGASASVAILSLANNFINLLWPRFLLGFFTAGLDPVFLRLITLYFPPERRGVAFGCFMFSVYLGSALASLSIILTD